MSNFELDMADAVRATDPQLVLGPYTWGPGPNGYVTVDPPVLPEKYRTSRSDHWSYRDCDSDKTKVSAAVCSFRRRWEMELREEFGFNKRDLGLGYYLNHPEFGTAVFISVNGYDTTWLTKLGLADKYPALEKLLAANVLRVGITVDNNVVAVNLYYLDRPSALLNLYPEHIRNTESEVLADMLRARANAIFEAERNEAVKDIAAWYRDITSKYTRQFLVLAAHADRDTIYGYKKRIRDKYQENAA